MNKRIINEGLDYLDMVGQINPVISVDEYKAKMGKDSDIVTLAFLVNSEAAGTDLVDWFERGYDWILDASVSEGELRPGKYLVFVEIKRRMAVPERIVELIEDLETLTELPINDWTVEINDEEYDPEVEVLRQIITTSPHEYRIKEEGELNEMRKRAGVDTVKLYGEPDKDIKKYISMAGL
jgi:hypothetical protein